MRLVMGVGGCECGWVTFVKLRRFWFFGVEWGVFGVGMGVEKGLILQGFGIIFKKN